MDVFLQGFVIGLGLTMMVGPITLTIIDSSLAAGWKAGLISGGAMWFSDLLIMSGIYFGGQEFLETFQMSIAKAWISYLAGAILLIIGIVLIAIKDKRPKLDDAAPSPANLTGHAIRGFVVNTFSPFTLLFWPTLIAGRVFALELTESRAIIFLLSILVAIIIGDTLKAFFANWLRKKISERYMKFTRLGIALLFIFAGFFMFYKGFTT